MESFKRDCERDGRTKVILGDEVMEILAVRARRFG